MVCNCFFKNLVFWYLGSIEDIYSMLIVILAEFKSSSFKSKRL